MYISWQLYDYGVHMQNYTVTHSSSSRGTAAEWVVGWLDCSSYSCCVYVQRMLHDDDASAAAFTTKPQCGYGKYADAPTV